MASATVGVLRILLTANAAELQTEMAKAGQTLGTFTTQMGSMGQQLTSIGAGLTAGITAPIAGIAIAAAKTAMGFESSFAGVKKTVDATDAEFAQMSQAIRNLAKDIPVSVEELNRLAETAGALNVPKQDIVSFAEVMAKLGTATNLTADQAATAIAKIQTQFGAVGKETSNFASALVELGNKGASTESEILELAERVASAGQAAGLNQAQILGFAAAMANVGLNAEAGGTALSKTFNDISAAVARGGEKLEAFAGVAGMSVEEFSEKFRTDAAGAMEAFIGGLGRVQAEGGNLVTKLDELGITETRQSDTLRRLAQNTDNVSSSLKIATQGWTENGALAEEARKRFETTASQIQVLWNRVKDLGIAFGTALLPAINGAISVLGALSQWFANLPGPIQTTIAVIAGLAAAIGPVLLVVGTLMTAFSAAIPVITAVGAVIAGLATGPFLLIGGAIAVLAGIWFTWGEDIKRITTEAIAVVKNLLVTVWQSEIMQSLMAMLTAMAEFFAAVFQKILQVAAEWYAGIKGWLVDKLKPVVETVAPVLKAIQEAWTKTKDTVIDVVSSMYQAIKTWLVDKFNAIVDGIKDKIDSITKFFKEMKDKVVGNSYVVEMMDGIATQFGRANTIMVEPTRRATRTTGDLFEDMSRNVKNKMQGMFDNMQQATSNFLGGSGGGVWGNIVSGGLSAVFGPGGIAMGLVSQGLSKLGDVVWKGLSAIGGFFKDIFGGPSAEELAGREIVQHFETNLASMLTESQKMEAGNEEWKMTVIAIRDAYLAAGLSEQEALRDAERLWKSSRDGGEDAQQVVDDITRKMQGFGSAIQDAFDEFPTEINIPVNFDVNTPDMPSFPTSVAASAAAPSAAAAFASVTPLGGLPLSSGGKALSGSSSGMVERNLEALIDRLEHVLPIVMRDALLMAR